MAGITIEQLIDIVNSDLTFSGMIPKSLPDTEIYRIVKESALEWFYKNYQFSKIKSYYFMSKDCLKTEQYTKFRYFILPEEVENITRIVKVDDPSLFRLGIQAHNLSINLGVTNQPFLTSFVTTAGDLTNVDTDLIFDVYVRIEQEELFDLQLFKDYVIGLCRIRMGQLIGMFSLTLPGNFQYNAADIISQGEKMVEKIEEKIKSETNASFFFMSR